MSDDNKGPNDFVFGLGIAILLALVVLLLLSGGGK